MPQLYEEQQITVLNPDGSVKGTATLRTIAVQQTQIAPDPPAPADPPVPQPE